MIKTTDLYKECHILVWNLRFGHWILFDIIWDLLFDFSSLFCSGFVTIDPFSRIAGHGDCYTKGRALPRSA